jgi:hypothetical protein
MSASSNSGKSSVISLAVLPSASQPKPPTTKRQIKHQNNNYLSLIVFTKHLLRPNIHLTTKQWQLK